MKGETSSSHSNKKLKRATVHTHHVAAFLPTRAWGRCWTLGANTLRQHGDGCWSNVFVVEWRRLAIRTALCALATALAVAIPDLAFVISLVGAFCMGVIGFILPSLMYVTLHAKVALCDEQCGTGYNRDIEVAKAGVPLVLYDNAASKKKPESLQAAWVHWSLFALGCVCTLFATVLSESRGKEEHQP